MAENESYSEKELLQRIAADDETAFQIVFNIYYDRIYSTALQYCKVEAAAEDIAQQVFLKLWEKRQTLHTVKSPADWLFIMTRNLVLDMLRVQAMNDKYIRYAQELFRAEEDSPEQQLIMRQRKELLEKSLDQLSPKQQEVYRLHRGKGMTYGEIADHLEIGHATVKDHMAKAIDKIRRFLTENKEELLSVITVGLYIKFFF